MADETTQKAEETGLAPAQAGGPPAAVDWSQAGDDIATSGKTQLDAADREGEQYDLDEIKLPRLTIAQGLSPQMVPGQPEYIKGLTIGDMFNDVTGEIYGSGPLKVVPFFDHTTRIEFDPNDKKVPLDREVPKGDPRTKWGKNPETGKGVPPAATEFVEMFSLVVRPGREPEPVVVTIKTTNKHQVKAAKMWRTYINQRGTKIYTGVYELTTMIARGTNAKGEATMYGHFIVKNAGNLDPMRPIARAIMDIARTFNEGLSTGTKKAAAKTGYDGRDIDVDAAEAQAMRDEANGEPMGGGEAVGGM
jgi:hypothetical protein